MCVGLSTHQAVTAIHLLTLPAMDVAGGILVFSAREDQEEELQDNFLPESQEINKWTQW